MNRKNESGATMLEVLCYLSLIVVISVATLQIYASESNKAERIRLENQVYDIIEKVQIFEFGNPGALKTTVAKLESAGIRLKHKWGNGTANDLFAGSSDGETECFIVRVENLPKQACMHLASQIKSECRYKSGSFIKKKKIKINGQNVGSKYEDGFELCTKDTNDNKVEIYANKN